MYKGKRISVSIPAYNEAKFIEKVINKVPEYVDFIVVTNDKSTDNTEEILANLQKNNKKLHVINSPINGGVGDSIMKAHDKGMELGADILAIFAGDDQMDPNYLPRLLDKIIENGASFAKGNRFNDIKELRQMPFHRVIGNVFFTVAHKVISGCWNIGDPLNGYTAITRELYTDLDKSKISKRYEFEVSLLSIVIKSRKKLADVSIPCKYADEVSDLNILTDSIKILWKMIKARFSDTPSVNWFYLAASVIFGLLLVFLTPPFQNPDEATHYFRAASLAEGHITCNNSLISVSNKKVSFVDQMHIDHLAGKVKNKFDTKLLLNYSEPTFNESSEVFQILCYQFPIAHLVPATGIFIANIFNLNSVVGFYLARIFSLFIAILLILYAINFAPQFKGVIIAIALIPMTVNQFSAINYDSVLIPCIFLYISLILYLKDKDKITTKHKILLILLLTIFSIIKIAYIPLILLLAVLRKNKEWIKTLIIASLSILLVLYLQNFLLGYAKIGTGSEFNPEAQLAYIKENPLKIIRPIAVSIKQFKDFYFYSTLGKLGWLDYTFDRAAYILILVTGTLYMLQNNKGKISFRDAMIFAFSFLGSVFAVFLSMYVLSTPYKANFVAGVQGRYFIPVLVLPIIIILSYLPRIDIKINKKIYIASFIIIVFLVIKALIQRYYLPS